MSAPMPSMSKLLMTQSISSLGPTTNPSRDRNMETTTLLMGNRILPTAGLPSTQSSLFLCFRLQEFQDHPVRKAWLYGNKKRVVSVPRFILLEICELFYGAANDSLSFLGGPARIRAARRDLLRPGKRSCNPLFFYLRARRSTSKVKSR